MLFHLYAFQLLVVQKINSPSEASLDIGVFGIFFPAVHTREQAELAVKQPVIRNTTVRLTTSLPAYGKKSLKRSWYWGINDYHAKAECGLSIQRESYWQ
ncbi:MAG: hypothetical protein CM1200mP40_03820 [Gammaproteobacteria bacterium]|nr:MAG: hypothetical protein CM1200mP40_03820 [Gammaproteobacteria bacterium]